MAVSYKTAPIKSTNVRFEFDLKRKLNQAFFGLLWFFAPGLMRRLIRRFFFRPVFYKMTDAQKEILSQARTFSFESQKKKLTGYHWGQGPAVVFIHGWAGRGLQCHGYVTQLVNQGFSVYTFDHVGHGESEGKTANYFRFSEAVTDFFTTIHAVEIHAVMAHSLGAAALINHLWRTRSRFNTILIAPSLHLVELLETTFNRFGVPKAAFDQMISGIEIETGHVFAKENPVDLMKTLTQEILIIHDKEDRAVPYEESWCAGLLQDNIRLFPTQGLGHIRVLHDNGLTDQVIEKIKSFPITESGSAPITDDNAENYNQSCDHLTGV